MDKVSVLFYKNTLMLTKFIAPHEEFKKYFKENMFDKPNTLGFIHVSYYLSCVHYKDSIKNKIHWPIICKQTENKFRNDVRECLMVIANDNPDVNFPPILASHLLLAKGTKFILIMWKFSLVVLRSYIREEFQSTHLYVPKVGPCQEITKSFLKNVIKNNNTNISEIRKERESMEQEVKDFENDQVQIQNGLKASILKLREKLKEITINASINDIGIKEIMNTEDNGIINLWNDFINNRLKSLNETDLPLLKKLYDLFSSVSNIVLNLGGNSKIFNGHNFEKIDVDPIYKLVPPEMQILPYSLYNKENLHLQNFFSILNLLLQKYKTNFQESQVETFAKFNTQLEGTNKDLKTAINHFQNLHEQILSFMTNELKKNDKFNESQKFIENVPEFSKILFMRSPSIQISCNDGGRNNNENMNDLRLTPIESAHKELFSRHGLSKQKNINCLKRKALPVQRINFDDSTLYDTSSDKQTMNLQRFSASKHKSTSKIADKYSRIFSSRTVNDSKVNNSVMMMMSSTGSSMLPLMGKQHYISLMDSCNLSQEFSQEPLLMNPNMNSIVNSTKLEDGEKVTQKNNKRRSISDLVERYKKLLQKSDVNSQVTSSIMPEVEINEEIKE